MKRNNLLVLAFALCLLIAAAGCKKDTQKSLSEIISKKWTAQKVDEGSVLVYTKGATTNVRPGYANYFLDLSAYPKVTLKEFDGNTFVGQAEVSPGGTKLTLKNLNPQPSETDGVIEFNINSFSDTELKLSTTKASKKTGNTLNVYTLSNP